MKLLEKFNINSVLLLIIILILSINIYLHMQDKNTVQPPKSNQKVITSLVILEKHLSEVNKYLDEGWRITNAYPIGENGNAMLFVIEK